MPPPPPPAHHSPSPRDHAAAAPPAAPAAQSNDVAAARRRQQQQQQQQQQQHDDHDSGIFDMSEDEEPAQLRVHTLAASSAGTTAPSSSMHMQSPPRLLHALPPVTSSMSGFEYVSRSRILGSAGPGAASPLPSSPKSTAASPAGITNAPAKRPPARMRASWLTDSFVESRRQSFVESIRGAAAAAAATAAATTNGTGVPSSIAPSSRRSSFAAPTNGYSDTSSSGGYGPAPLVEIFEPGERLGPGLMHDGHPIKIAHTSEGFRAQDRDDSGSQLEIVRKLGEGSYAVVYLVREIIPLPAEPQHTRSTGTTSIDDMDQYSRTLRASDHSPWSSPHPPPRTLPTSKPTGRKFALKCLCKRHLDDHHLEIQRLEATIHQSIGFHPNIVTLYRVYETPDWLFLVLEYCPGQDLYYWLERSQDTAGGLTPAGSIYRGEINSEFSSPARDLSPKPLPSLHSNEPWDMDEDLENTPPNPSLLGSTSNLSLLSRRRLRLVSRMFRQMCDAVQFCHDRGISHRDLKPENFIVEDRRWFFDWEEEEDAYDNDDTIPVGGDARDTRLNINLVAATPTAASMLEQRGLKSPPERLTNRPSPSRSASSFRGGLNSRESKVVVKLTDFGLATAEEQCRDFDCGSKPYMAFECANDTAPWYDAKQADIWSLGVCLLNLIFHRSPFTEPNADRCESFASFCYDPIKFLTEAFEGLTRDAAEFLSKRVFCEISDKYPGRRRVSAKAFADWAESLPEHMGLGSSDVSRVLTRGPDPNVTSPLSHSRTGSFSSYLPFTFDAASSVLGAPETVPLEDLPDHLAEVELPEELGDSTYIERSAGNETITEEAELGTDVLANDDTKDDDSSSKGDASSTKDDSKDNSPSAKQGTGTKPRRRKRGARKGRNAAAKAGDDATQDSAIPTAHDLPPRPASGPALPALSASASQREYVIDQLAAASQQLARDLSAVKLNGASTYATSSNGFSGQSTAVPPTPLSNSATYVLSPVYQVATGSVPYFSTPRQPELPAFPSQVDQHPEEVLAEYLQEHDQRRSAIRRPLNPGLTQATSWRERAPGTSSFNSHSTLSSHSGTASTHSTASAPAGLPGPRHRPADLKMADKAVDVSYLAAVFNGVKDKMSSSQLLGGMGRNKSNGVTPGAGHHARPSSHTASAPARQVHMPSTLLQSAVGAPMPVMMPSPELLVRANGPTSATTSASPGRTANNDLTGERPQWRDHSVSVVQPEAQRLQVRTNGAAAAAAAAAPINMANLLQPAHHTFHNVKASNGLSDLQQQPYNYNHHHSQQQQQQQQQHPRYHNQQHEQFHRTQQKAMLARATPGPTVPNGNSGPSRADRAGPVGGSLKADVAKSWRRH